MCRGSAAGPEKAVSEASAPSSAFPTPWHSGATAHGPTTTACLRDVDSQWQPSGWTLPGAMQAQSPFSPVQGTGAPACLQEAGASRWGAREASRALGKSRGSVLPGVHGD